MNWDEYFMRMVYLVASKSKDPRTQVGAVVVNDDRQVLTTGYNGICRGVLDPADVNRNTFVRVGSCGFMPLFESDEDYQTIRRREESPEKYLWYEHAERNSIFQAARIGVSLMGATMYTQGIPCCDCGRGIIQAGIKKVVVHKLWPRNGLEGNKKQDVWTESITVSRKMFAEAGIMIDILETTLNVKGYIDGDIVNV